MSGKEAKKSYHYSSDEEEVLAFDGEDDSENDNGDDVEEDEESTSTRSFVRSINQSIDRSTLNKKRY